MVPLFGNSVHFLSGHAVLAGHVPAQAVHISIRLMTVWTSRFAAVHLHMIT